MLTANINSTPASQVMFPDFPAGSTRTEVKDLIKQRMELRGGGVDDSFWDVCPKEIVTTPVYKTLLQLLVNVLPMSLLVEQTSAATTATPLPAAVQPA
jgi:hypothetical protein